MRRRGWVTIAVTMLMTTSAPLIAQQQASTPIYRLFLTDGTSLASFGEWARLDDRVVFSMPLSVSATPDLHLVSIPTDRVDWEKTDRYTAAARASHYALTRGDADFAKLSATIAHTLNEVALEKDPQQRLTIAERARRTLADWPASHFGYRDRDVREIIGMLDEIIAEMRAAAGLSRFDFALTASMAPQTPEALLPPPDRMDTIEQLMAVAAMTETPAERVSVLQTVVSLLDRAVGALPTAWAAAIRRTASGHLAEEQRIDRAYSKVRTRTLETATRLAAGADVRGLERLRSSLTPRDAALVKRRPSEMAALVATVDAQLDAARRLRLARDQWQLRAAGQQAYRRALAGPLETLTGASANLEDIRVMAGPAPRALTRLSARLSGGSARLERLVPPAELQ
ncbi:MAG: hypothetical protein LC791_17630, partial [Acidobacteria bacterium]|nr:hypothetical protein [Acidobacteriota bacterium]